jgi:hypothetical protein
MNAGVNNYISGISSDKHIKSIQLWQFLGCKILFRLSSLSYGQFVCKQCGLHTEYPCEYNIKCTNKISSTYDLSEYPIQNIVSDGYTFNKKKIKDCHKHIFD